MDQDEYSIIETNCVTRVDGSTPRHEGYKTSGRPIREPARRISVHDTNTSMDSGVCRSLTAGTMANEP
eukprot:4147047-Lingulodinium_polyedra.AAC.1